MSLAHVDEDGQIMAGAGSRIGFPMSDAAKQRVHCTVTLSAIEDLEGLDGRRPTLDRADWLDGFERHRSEIEEAASAIHDATGEAPFVDSQHLARVHTGRRACH